MITDDFQNILIPLVMVCCALNLNVYFFPLDIALEHVVRPWGQSLALIPCPKGQTDSLSARYQSLNMTSLGINLKPTHPCN